jgi:cation diffusion facilitator family transporter
MHYDNIRLWQHSHVFGQDQKHPGELRTFIVVAITAAMMIIEVTTGIIFGSMALFADGLHMASHAVALAINAFAYVYARRHANDVRYSLGTGKINALGGFTGGVLLIIFALIMAGESIERIINPVAIAFNQAIFVAILGLIVNGLSVFILGDQHHHDLDGHDDPGEHEHTHHQDHNLRAAYLHVLADALTSVLAIFALLLAKFVGLIWMDPLMGIVGAILVSRWSVGLLRATSGVLLDKQAPDDVQSEIMESIESHTDDRVADLHVWSVGPSIYAAIVSVVAHDPRAPAYYKDLLPSHLDLVHVTVEVHQCIEDHSEPAGHPT